MFTLHYLQVVYNYRGTVDTAHFLGQIFRTLSQVLNLARPENLGSQSQQQQPPSDSQTVRSRLESQNGESRLSEIRERNLAAPQLYTLPETPVKSSKYEYLSNIPT